MKESVFMQMHNGTRAGEGSFNVALKKLFYLADKGNRHKLVNAFPEFFGDEVPEFGISKQETGSKSVTIKIDTLTNSLTITPCECPENIKEMVLEELKRVLCKIMNYEL